MGDPVPLDDNKRFRDWVATRTVDQCAVLDQQTRLSVGHLACSGLSREWLPHHRRDRPKLQRAAQTIADSGLLQVVPAAPRRSRPLLTLEQGYAPASGSPVHHRICITNRTLTKSGQATGMPDDPEHPFALRQIDQPRTDFAAIESKLDIIRHHPARWPARRDLSRH